MGNETSRSITHVANATGHVIRVFYSVDKMTMEEMVVDIGVGAEVSGSASKSEGASVSGSISASTNTKMVFKRDSRIRYIRIPVQDFAKFAGEGVVYASVFVEDDNDGDTCNDTIALNFHVPSDRSFIVTANRNIRFQKYGASLWEDEYGNRH